MATVTKREWTGGDGKAKAAWRVAYTDAAGKRRFKQFRSKKEADAYALTVQWEVRQGVHTPDAESISVADAADLWLSACEGNGCDRGTLKSYREMSDRHIKPLIGTKRVSRLTAPDVVVFADAMKVKASAAMAGKAVRHLSMILGVAQNHGKVAQNVAHGVTVKRPRGDKKRVVIPPKEHLRAMLDAADRMDNEDPRVPVMVRVAMLAGLRQSELRGLSWSDVDLKGQRITVSRRADRWCDTGVPKSEAGFRTIPIGPTLVSTLTAWKLRCPTSPLNLVFPSRPQGRPCKRMKEAGDKPITQHSMAERFLTVQIGAGLAIDAGLDGEGSAIWKSRYGWHCLRHAAASAWIKQGVDLKRLQVWIGHANIQLTLNTYGHLITDALGDAALADGAEAALLA